MGGFRVVYEYANHLVSRGHRVTVAHVCRFPHWEKPVPDSIVSRLRSRAAYLRDMFLVPRVKWQSIDSGVRMLYSAYFNPELLPDADVLFATGLQTVEDVLACPAMKGTKYYLIQGYETWWGSKERVHASWHAPLRKVVISEWLYNIGLELGIRPDDMVHIPNGVDPAIFRMTEPIESRTPRIAMLYEPGLKGGEDGVEAMAIARAKFSSLGAVLFHGSHARPAALPDWMEYVRNPPQQSLIERIYNKSSIYLCPSWVEGWGLPPAEAMACGCAVVSTDNGGILDYATHLETALLSPPRQPEVLAQNIIKLLGDDGFRRQLANKGHQCIKEFNWERSTNMLENYLLKNT